MVSLDDHREMTLIESKGILIKDQPYQVVLTNRRIILTNTVDHTTRSIYFRDMQKTELASDDSGDPIIMVFVPSVTGEIKKVILHFSQKNFPDAQLQSSLWSSEINSRIQHPAQVSVDVTHKNVSSGSLFCTKCGKKAIEGSVFCDKCGSKILYPLQPDPPEPGDESIHNRVMTPEISTGHIELLPKKVFSPSPHDPYTRENIPVIASPQKDDRKKRSFFARFDRRKTAIITGLGLAVIILVIAAIFVAVPSVLPGFNLTTSGMNFSVPALNITAPSTIPLVTTTLSQPPGNPAIRTPTRTPAIPAPTITLTVSPAHPAFIAAPGDPAMVLAAYPSFFNKGDGTGIQSLLAGDIKSQYPLEDLNNELDVARSNGYSIENIQVKNQIIEGTNATLIVEISWNTGGSSQTSTQNLLLVHENDQWKLNTLILHP
jgi:hypothetical protein